MDLGARRHANQPTAALGAMASTITQAVLRRLADEGRAPEDLLAGAGAYARPVPGPRRPGAGRRPTPGRPSARRWRGRGRGAGVSAAYLDLDGTLLGPSGSLLHGADGRFSDAGPARAGPAGQAPASPWCW